MTLKEMQSVDIRTVDPATLADIDDVVIKADLPKPEMMADMARQMNGNLYFFKCKRRDGGYTIVQSSFAETTVSATERVESFMRTL